MLPLPAGPEQTTFTLSLYWFSLDFHYFQSFQLNNVPTFPFDSSLLVVWHFQFIFLESCLTCLISFAFLALAPFDSAFGIDWVWFQSPIRNRFHLAIQMVETRSDFMKFWHEGWSCSTAFQIGRIRPVFQCLKLQSICRLCSGLGAQRSMAYFDSFASMFIADSNYSLSPGRLLLADFPMFLVYWNSKLLSWSSIEMCSRDSDRCPPPQEWRYAAVRQKLCWHPRPVWMETADSAPPLVLLLPDHPELALYLTTHLRVWAAYSVCFIWPFVQTTTSSSSMCSMQNSCLRSHESWMGWSAKSLSSLDLMLFPRWAQHSAR